MKTIKLITTIVFLIVLTASINAQINTYLVKKYEKASKGVIFSPDNKYMVTAGFHGLMIYEFNETKQKHIKTINYTKAVYSVSFSADGKYLAASSYQTVKIYSVSNGHFSLLKTLNGFTSFVHSICFSGDGKYLATGSYKKVNIYNVSNGSFSLMKTLNDYTDNIYSVIFSANGNYLAIGSYKTVNIYSIYDGSFSLSKTLNHTDYVRSLSFSYDGKYLATSSNKIVKIYSDFSFLKDITDHSKWVTSVHFFANGKYLATGSEDKTVKIYSVSNDDFLLLKTLTEHINSVYSISFSSNGKYLATGGEANLIIYELNIKEILQPAILSIKNSTFIDANKNGILEAGENAQLSINIKNYGKGKANNLKCFTKVSPSISGLSYSLPSSVNIAANGEQTINIPISTNIDLPTKNISIKVSFTETNGFQPAPLSFNITTKAMAKAKLELSTNNTEIIKQNLSKINFSIKNNGNGIAKNVKIKFTLPANVHATGKLEYTIGSISAKSEKIQPFSFLVTAKYQSKTLPVKVSVTEKYAKFVQNKIFDLKVTEKGIILDNTKLTISINQPATENSNSESESQEIKGSITSKNPLQSIKINDIPIAAMANFSHKVSLKVGNNSFKIVVTDKKGKSTNKTININRQPIIANIDIEIPVTSKKKKNTYVLIIGNENYKGTISNVPYAINDANIFRQYLIKTIGLGADNITLIKDATAINMSKEIDNFINRQKINPEAEFIFYYSGHGTNDNRTKIAYLLPSDIENSKLNKFAVSISELYNDLTTHKTKRVTVFLDACFSGLGREKNIVKGSRAGGGRVPKPFSLKGNIVVFSASSKKQQALPYHKKHHGLFTYCLLKILQETKGKITYKQLSELLPQRVGNEALNNSIGKQTPETNASPKLKNAWKKWKLK